MEAQLDALAAELAAAFERDVIGVRKRLDGICAEAREASVADPEIAVVLEHWRALFERRGSHLQTLEAALADLGSVLLGSETKKSRAWNGLRRVSGWIFEHYVQVASLVAVIATAFYGLAYAWFYDGLDITAEQAGLEPTQILTRSVLGGLTLVALVSFGVFATFLWAIPFREDAAAAKEKGSWPQLGGNLLLIAISIGYLIWLLGLIAESPYAAPVAVFPLTVVIVLFSLRVKKIDGSWSLHPRPLRFDASKYLTLFAAIAVPVALVIACGATLWKAREYGDVAGNGGSVRDPKILGMPFLGVRAEPALVSWTGAEPPLAGIPHCVTYLGTNGGDAVFYDHRTRSAIHVPAGEVVFELRSRMLTCSAPVNVRTPLIRRTGRDELSCHAGRWQSRYKSEYRFRWMSEGLEIDNRSGKPRRFREVPHWSRNRVYCQVTAVNIAGHDTAVSPAVVTSVPQLNPGAQPRSPGAP